MGAVTMVTEGVKMARYTWKELWELSGFMSGLKYPSIFQ